MTEAINMTYENNVFYCTKNGTKWISIDGEKWYGEEKRIAELEEKISVLLSCKNCPENKGGYICEKEYEGKCLSQKTQYIKELKEEIAELDMKRKAERKIFQGIVEKNNDQLTKAKEIIRTFLNMPMPNNEEVFTDVGVFLTKAEQFLKEIEK